MQPAADAMAEALAHAGLRAPALPVYVNVTAAPAHDPADIRRLLVEPVPGMARGRESVGAMADAGVPHSGDFCGTVLSHLVERIAPAARKTDVISLAAIETHVQEIWERSV